MHVVAVGTGAAVRNAMNCDGDVLLVHSQQREKAFVAEGYAPRRYALMYNDFVIIGPASDPAGLAGKQDAVDALQAMAAKKSRFISRGDDSGTHIKELNYGEWQNLTPPNILVSGTAKWVPAWALPSILLSGWAPIR